MFFTLLWLLHKYKFGRKKTWSSLRTFLLQPIAIVNATSLHVLNFSPGFSCNKSGFIMIFNVKNCADSSTTSVFYLRGRCLGRENLGRISAQVCPCWSKGYEQVACILLVEHMTFSISENNALTLQEQPCDNIVELWKTLG